MEDVIIRTGKSVENVIEKVLEETSWHKDEINYEVLSEKKGFLGITGGSVELKITKNTATTQDNNNSVAESLVTIEQFVKRLLKTIGIEPKVTSYYESETDVIMLNFISDEKGVLIGKHGRTLTKLQYLINVISLKNNFTSKKIILDSEGYRDRRIKSLKKLANNLSIKVYKTGKERILEPMSSYERRIIHAELKDNDKVFTKSVGRGIMRRIAVIPKNTEIDQNE